MFSKRFQRYSCLKNKKVNSNDIDINVNDNEIVNDVIQDDTELSENTNDNIINVIGNNVYNNCESLKFYENDNMKLLVNELLNIPLYENAIISLKDILVRLLIKKFVFKNSTGRSIIFSYAEEIEYPLPKPNNLQKILKIYNNPSSFERIFMVMIGECLPFLRI